MMDDFSAFAAKYKLVVLRDPTTMECEIARFDEKYICYEGTDVEVLGFAETLRQAYGVIDFYTEMER